MVVAAYLSFTEMTSLLTARVIILQSLVLCVEERFGKGTCTNDVSTQEGKGGVNQFLTKGREFA